jgi:hypothetical protein
VSVSRNTRRDADKGKGDGVHQDVPIITFRTHNVDGEVLHVYRDVGKL